MRLPAIFHSDTIKDYRPTRHRHLNANLLQSAPGGQIRASATFSGLTAEMLRNRWFGGSVIHGGVLLPVWGLVGSWDGPKVRRLFYGVIHSFWLYLMNRLRQHVAGVVASGREVVRILSSSRGKARMPVPLGLGSWISALVAS